MWHFTIELIIPFFYYNLTNLRYFQQINYIIFFTTFIIILVIIQRGFKLVGKFCNWINYKRTVVKSQFNSKLHENNQIVNIFLIRCWNLDCYWSRSYYSMAALIISLFIISVYVFVKGQVYRMRNPFMNWNHESIFHLICFLWACLFTKYYNNRYTDMTFAE